MDIGLLIKATKNYISDWSSEDTTFLRNTGVSLRMRRCEEK